MSWWTLLDKGTIVCGYVAVVAVFLQHVYFCLDLLFLLLCDIHHLDGGQLAGLHMATLGKVNVVNDLIQKTMRTKKKKKKRS